MVGKTLAFALLLLLANTALAYDTSLEPCMNGDVSATGSFPSQEMEKQIHAYLEWRSDQPYYLFQVASESINTPYQED
jgi:hypothetical protein